MDPHLYAALDYAALGWRVHPCRPGEKLPILTDWPKRATTDQAIIDRWWGHTPEANIAVATGPGSGVFVLDVDGPEGERTLADLERRHGPLPEIYPMQWTGSGRGWQAFFRYPDGRNIRNSAGKLGPKLDTRGDGGYVVIPPSLHPSGRRYGWATDREPWSVPPEPAPDCLVNLLDPPEQPHLKRPAFETSLGGFCRPPRLEGARGRACPGRNRARRPAQRPAQRQRPCSVPLRQPRGTAG